MGEWSWFFGAVDALTQNYGDPFLAVGKGMYISLSIVMLIIVSTKSGILLEESISSLMHLVTLMLVVGFILVNYNEAHYPPIGIGVPIKGLIPNTIANLTDIIQSSQYDEAMRRCSFIMDHLESPNVGFFSGVGDAHALLAYGVVEATMFILGSLVMLPMMVGVIFLGIGAVIWPLFIPWLIVPRMSWLFWNALSYILKYSFYRLFAVAIMFVISGVLIQMIDHTLTLDMQTQIAGHSVEQYSLAQFTGLTVIEIGSLVPLSLWAIKELPNALRELFSGTAGAGATLMRDMSQAITTFRK